jgi:hypothetical protein
LQAAKEAKEKAKKAANGAESGESANVAAKPKLCRFFASTGACKAGAACHFAHDPPPNAAAADRGGLLAADGDATTPPKKGKKLRPCRNGAACRVVGCAFDHPLKAVQVLQRGGPDEAPTSRGESTAGASPADAAKTALFCSPCGVQCSSAVSLADHCKGKKHAAALDHCRERPPATNGSAAGAADAKAAEKKEAKKKKTKKGKDEWWRAVEDIDPISLEPISELDYPPFELARESPAAAPTAEKPLGRGATRSVSAAADTVLYSHG